MAKADLTAQRLRELLYYNPETGRFTWRVSRRGSAARAGQEVLERVNDNGYALVGVDRCSHRAHRLVWLHVHGVWPVKFIDHINGVRTDNRLANLREATNAENLQNLRYAKSHSSHGFLGVTYSKTNSRWIGQITRDGQHFYLGSFKTVEEARAAYIGAKKVLHAFAPQQDE